MLGRVAGKECREYKEKRLVKENRQVLSPSTAILQDSRPPCKGERELLLLSFLESQDDSPAGLCHDAIPRIANWSHFCILRIKQ